MQLHVSVWSRPHRCRTHSSITYIRTELNNYEPVDAWTEQTVSDLRTELKPSKTVEGKGLEEILSRTPSQEKQP